MKRSKRAKRGKLKASIFFMYMYHRKQHIMSWILRSAVSLFFSITLSLSLHTSHQRFDKPVVPKLDITSLNNPYINIKITKVQPDALPELYVPQESSVHLMDLDHIHQTIDQSSPRMIIAMKKKRDCNKAMTCLCRWLCWPCACLFNKITSSNS